MLVVFAPLIFSFSPLPLPAQIEMKFGQMCTKPTRVRAKMQEKNVDELTSKSSKRARSSVPLHARTADALVGAFN
jgi:hypothetical protein